MVFVFLAAGLAFLVVGAELLVRGASRLASSVGVSALVIGLTVVAFGTSAPELAVSMKAAASGQADIALGNVVGSNIFNVLFILGLSALIAPLAVSKQLIRLDVPLMIAISAGVLLLARDGRIGTVDAVLLVVSLAVYVGFLFYFARSNSDAAATESGDERVHWGLNIAFVIAGLAMLILGSRWFVNGAISIAETLGVSEVVIGLTIVAAGTSMPEVVTSVVASLRGERDIAVGNVVGSNIFNLLGVLGIAALTAPDGIDISRALVSFDIPVMTAVAFACLPIFITGGRISRWEGGLLLVYYAAYTAYVVMAATSHDALPEFSAVMLYFTIPITALTLVIVTFMAVRKKKPA